MSKKLLIIDEDDLFLAVMQIRLEREGLYTVTCRTIQDAVRLFKEINPDLVLVTIRSVHGGSKEIFTQIKKLNPAARIIPLVLSPPFSVPQGEMNREVEGFSENVARSEHIVIDIRNALSLR